MIQKQNKILLSGALGIIIVMIIAGVLMIGSSHKKTVKTMDDAAFANYEKSMTKYQLAKDSAQAEVATSEVLKQNLTVEQHQHALVDLGSVYDYQGNYTIAIQKYKQAEMLSKKRSLFIVQAIINASLKKGDNSELKVYYAAARDLQDPKDPMAKANINYYNTEIGKLK